MNNNLEQLKKISTYLNHHTYSEKILRMQRAFCQKEYLLTVMGQFSSGKSCLINHILGKQILPVHITETTAAITFVRYGEEEYARLLYKDGTIEDISVEDSLKLWQSGEDNGQLSNIEQINIYVNSELLKDGLVIADTPGVNTIINKHIELTAGIIEAADRVLYVMGKSITDTDVNFVRSILENGVKIIFVRTHMDDLKDTEESISDTILKEESVLSEYTQEEIFFVSNDETNYYYNEINRLQEYLSQTLAENVAYALEQSIAESMQFMAQKLKEELVDRKKSLECVLHDDRQEYLKRKADIETSLQSMEDILRKNKANLTAKYQETKQSALENLNASEAMMIKKAQRKISALDYGTVSEKYKEDVENILKTGLLKLQTSYLSYFDHMLKDNKELIHDQLAKFSPYTQFDNGIPETLNEVSRKTQEIAEKLNALNFLKEQLANELVEIQNNQSLTEIKEETLADEQRMLEAALANVQEELREYPEYVAQYYETQSAMHNGENVMRTLGQLADFATILIPAGGWAKFGSKLLNVGSKGAKVVNATKAAEQLARAADTITKSQKALKAIDAGADATRIGAEIFSKQKLKKKEQQRLANEMADKARQMNKTVDTVKNKITDMRNQKSGATSVLDYLTLEHYFAQIGKTFDKPQIVQIDREYEKRYYDSKREIEQRMHRQAEEEFKKRQELLDIKDLQEQLKLKHDITCKKQRAAEKEEQELKNQLDISARNDKINAIREYYSNFAADKIAEFCIYLRRDKSDEIDKRITGYISNFDFNITKNINRKRFELEELNKCYENSEKEDLKSEAAFCTQYQEFLETIVVEKNS